LSRCEKSRQRKYLAHFRALNVNQRSPQQLLRTQRCSNLIDMGRVSSRPHPHKTIVFLSVAVLANSFGNLLLALAMNRMPDFMQVPFNVYLLSMLHDPFLIPGAALTATYALLQLTLFSWADLSFVVPCIASSYIVSTLLAQFILGEHVNSARWFGVLLIFFGVILVVNTPEATKAHPAEAHTP
jgi:drug/metabolite transporter (DMT)-like permease